MRAIQMDVAERGSIRRSLAAVETHFAGVDILVDNAAIAQALPFAEIGDADWDPMLGVNLRGPFACCQEVIPGMLERRWGRIINIASIGGQWGGFHQVHYAASKAGLISLTHSLARLYSGSGVTSNAVAPGLVATEMSSRELETPEGRKRAEAIPLGRLSTSEEAAAAVVFLASEGAASVNGQTLNVNGG